ncbi:MAG: dihydrofolate reductase family protein [Cyanobacteria bacterium J06634_5]
MRKLTYYVACSVDGFIAQSNGAHDGFSQEQDYLAEIFSTFPETVPSHLRAAMGIQSENQCFDTVLMGRKTYEIGLQEGITSPYSHMKQYLFSRTLSESPDPAVELIFQQPIERVMALKQAAGKGIWLCGGATLAATLFSQHLIDQLILKVNPFLMGSGIPLFSEAITQTTLTLTERHEYKNDVMRLHYQVNPHNDTVE